MMATMDIAVGSRVQHAEYGDGVVEFIVRSVWTDAGLDDSRPYASVLFDDLDNTMLPELSTLTVTGHIELPTVPDFARLSGYAPARPTSIHGIRPASLFHYTIDGEGPFIVCDGQLHSPCKRCKGWGEYSQNDYDGSMCYGCYGSGVGALTTWDDAQRLAKQRKARRDREARAAMAKRHAEAIAWDAFRTGNEDVIGFLSAKDTNGTGFVADMARKVRDAEPLTDNMVAALRRIMVGNAERTATRQAAGHVGTVGKRETFEVRIMSVRIIETQFGISRLVTMETRDGAVVKTFGSGEWARNAEANPDVWVSIKATVKAHDEYQGEPQTMLTRVANA